MAACSLPQDLRRRSGFTLVEILLAIVIGVLLIAVVVSTYRTVGLAVRGQAERSEGPLAAYRALDQLQIDLQRVFAPQGDEANALRLGRDEAQAPSAVLELSAMTPDPMRDDLRFAELRRVAYRLTGEGEARSLVRSERATVGPGTAAPDAPVIVLKDVTRFHVSLFDGTEWIAAWPPAKDAAMPRAARVELMLDGRTNVWAVEVPIPVGLVVTSRIMRTVAPP